MTHAAAVTSVCARMCVHMWALRLCCVCVWLRVRTCAGSVLCIVCVQRDSIVSCVGSMARPESYTAEDEEDQEIDSTHHTTHTTDHAHRSNDAPAPATDAALLSLAAHVLGLSDDKAAGEQVASTPALAVGGTGLGAHSGGEAAGVHTRASPPLPQSPHPSVASQDSSLPRMPSGGLARSNSTPGRAGSFTPGRSRPPPVRTTPPLPTGGPSGAGRGGVAGGGTDVSGEYSGGSAPSSVSGYPVTPSGSGVAKRPPTPPPGRLNTSLSNRARSSASSHRSGTSSPLHSARYAHTHTHTHTCIHSTHTLLLATVTELSRYRSVYVSEAEVCTVCVCVSVA